MSGALYFIGGFLIIVSVISGVFSGSLLGFIICSIGGVVVGSLLFALSQINDNQLKILYQLQLHNEFTRQLHTKTIKCPNCDYEYDDQLTSCPNCGNR